MSYKIRFDHYWDREIVMDRYRQNTELHVVWTNVHNVKDIYDISSNLVAYKVIADKVAERAMLAALGLERNDVA